MKKTSRIFQSPIILIFVLLPIFFACKKQDQFLSEKPNNSLANISSLGDLEKLLNSEDIFNHDVAPVLGHASGDDYFFSTSIWLTLNPWEQNTYNWNKIIFSPTESRLDLDWVNTYRLIYYANTVLDALPTLAVTSGQQAEADRIKGAALFCRSFAFFNLLQIYAPQYDSASASVQPGIPLRLNSDLNIASTRASEEQCYNQIIADLETAVQLLPDNAAAFTKPGKVAALAILARVYLAMGKYSKCYESANAALSVNNVLFDYNDIIPGVFYLFADNSQFPIPEDLFHITLNGSPANNPLKAAADTALYNSYESNDLRKTAFFFFYNGAYRFKGSYDQKLNELFAGPATDEVYLMRAECNARLGRSSEAMQDLNNLLIKRYQAGTYINRTAASPNDALSQIITERRKELLFRGIRWMDLRRLNKEGKYPTTLERITDGATYTLPPNDLKYTLPIPDFEISRSGIQQNPR